MKEIAYSENAVVRVDVSTFTGKPKIDVRLMVAGAYTKTGIALPLAVAKDVAYAILEELCKYLEANPNVVSEVQENSQPS